ncbi:MAG: HAMP domain-containing histidine kinase [Bacteroidia bacterium]|jgi:signal transduction histidine kinase|nr:HAMP domain-containing histidine kinase [Bacteroidia bacterium]MCC6768578.1 HAMP domain-containing histidine kinase [Bacteroidia bacterium]
MNRKTGRLPKTMLFFYGLVFYVFLQFAWWSYLLYDLNNQVILLNEQLELSRGEETDYESTLRILNQKHLMVWGEGIVFLSLLVLGVIQTRKSFKRETQLALQQNNFILSVTHELKTPLSSLKLFLQTIKRRDLSREQIIPLTEKALVESNRLDHLIENILLVNQMESPAFSLNIENVMLSDFLENLSGNFKAGLLPEDVEFELNIRNNLCVVADKQALYSVLMNLLENAVKYASGGKWIGVQAKMEAGEIVIIVADRGAGIPDKEKQNVFKHFYRLGNEETRLAKGTGLGLYICRTLIQAMGGHISIKNNLPGGAVFEVRLKSCS